MRCAHNPPPCNFFERFHEPMFGSAAFLILHFLSSFAVGFSRFGEVIIMFFCHFGRREPHLGGPGPHFEDFWDYCDFGGAFATKYSSHLESKMQALTHFFQCCCLMFFWVLVFLNFCDFECPETLFWLPFWLHLGSPGPLKNSWKCVTVINFRGLTLPDSVFLHVPTMGAFWEWYCSRFIWF